MNRSEQIQKARKQLMKKRDKVFEAHRLSEEGRLILSEHDIKSKKQRRKRLSPMLW